MNYLNIFNESTEGNHTKYLIAINEITSSFFYLYLVLRDAPDSTSYVKVIAV